EDLNASGDLDSVGVLTIHGNGAVIDGGSNNTVLQSFDALSIDDVTIQNGQQVGVVGSGKAMSLDRTTLSSTGVGLTTSANSATIRRSTFTGNATGIFQAAGTLGVTDSTIANGTGSSGVGIEVEGGAATIAQSTISDNAGLGVEVFSSAAATLRGVTFA